jgi:hypothetical protein
MMGSKGMRSADEYDALTKFRRYLHWRAGERKSIKNRFRRRMRRDEKACLAEFKSYMD